MNGKPYQSLPDIPVSPRKIVLGIVIAFAAYLGFSSFYTVPAESVGVVQRFGHYHDVVDPGLHFKVPLGVDTMTQVPVERQLKEEFGFGTPGATFTEQISGPREWELETTIVTGDLNTALVRRRDTAAVYCGASIL